MPFFKPVLMAVESKMKAAFFYYQLPADPISEIYIEFRKVSTVYGALFKLSVCHDSIGYIF